MKEPQPEPSPVGAVRLTDQALVAVTVARAQAGDRAATVVDLVIGLAAEPDGAAGHVLRDRPGAVAALQAARPPAAAPLDEAVARAAAMASGRAAAMAPDRGATMAPGRPAATLDLLAAALDVGGETLVAALEDAGADVDDLRPGEGRDQPLFEAPWDVDWAGHAETFGLDPRGDPLLAPPAARAVAQVRAVGGGALEVVLALSSSPDADLGGALPPHDRLSAAGWRLRKRGRPADVPVEPGGSRPPSPVWDAGLDAVVEAARAWRTADRVTALDLVRAAVLAGGVGPRTLLEEAERP